jgi:hypothetical protein
VAKLHQRVEDAIVATFLTKKTQLVGQMRNNWLSVRVGRTPVGVAK